MSRECRSSVSGKAPFSISRRRGAGDASAVLTKLKLTPSWPCDFSPPPASSRKPFARFGVCVRGKRQTFRLTHQARTVLLQGVVPRKCGVRARGNCRILLEIMRPLRDACVYRKPKPGRSDDEVVCRGKAQFLRGCKSLPARVAPAGSNRSRRGGNEPSEAFDGKDRLAIPRVCGP